MSEVGLLSIAVLAAAVATVMSVLVWRLRRIERRRSEARVATLAADIRAAETYREPVAVGNRRDGPWVQTAPSRRFNIDAIDAAPTLGLDRTARSRSRLAPVLALGILAIVVALALIVATRQAVWRSAEIATPAAARGANLAKAPAPLELTALGQERADDRLTVRGIVRNPGSGTTLDHLAAVVLLFNTRGEFLRTGRAPVERVILGPGSESMFSVTVEGARDVGRYRIRFHRDDRIVPHVDRRNRGSDAE